jgi:hypothetical protein
MKLKPVRQLPSGAKRASGMLINPVCPVTLGVSANAGDASVITATIADIGRSRK